MNAYKKFLKFYAAFLGCMALLFLPVYCLVVATDEITPYSEIVKVQRANNGLFGSAFNQNSYLYKMELVKAVRPQVIALSV